MSTQDVPGMPFPFPQHGRFFLTLQGHLFCEGIPDLSQTQLVTWESFLQWRAPGYSLQYPGKGWSLPWEPPAYL